MSAFAAEPSTARLRPSSQRPIPFRARPDLVIEPIRSRNVATPVVKDALALKYYRLQPEQSVLLRLLDGRRSLEEVRDELQREFPALPVTLRDVQLLAADLHEKGLVISERTGQGSELLRERRKRRLRKFRQVLLNPLYVRLPGWDPDRSLVWLAAAAGWTLRWWATLPLLAFVAVTYLFLMTHFDEVLRRLPEFQQFFAWPNLLYLWGTLALIKVIHEFGHGLACKHFGCECHSMGVMLLMFSPTLYCDVTDSWMLHSKWKRIFIAAAGMYVEVVLSAVAVCVWWNTQMGLLNHLSLNVFFVSTVTTVVFNANPLMRFDGYYILADFLEIPNLRPKAGRLLQQAFAWYGLGVEFQRDPFMPTTGRAWFALFAVASMLYRWTVTFGITVFFYTVLRPYRLQSVGITMAVVLLAMIAGQLAWNFWKLISAPRAEPISKAKLSASLSLLTLAIVGVLFVPCPWYVTAPFTIEPLDVRHVYTHAPGVLQSISAKVGESVSAGDPLVRLSNEDFEAEVRRLRAELASQEHEIARFLASQDPDRRRIAIQQQRSLAGQLREAEQELSKLDVRSPVSGCVIAPPRVTPPPREQARRQLPHWFGTPLDERNLQAHLVAGVHLCSLAPHDSFQAVLLIDQADREEVRPGIEVRLKLETLPALKLSGRFRSVSEQAVDVAPSALSNKSGGPLATTTDAAGRERLSLLMYQAIVPIPDAPNDRIRTGMRGEARLLIQRRPVWEWVWRSLTTTFKFRL